MPTTTKLHKLAPLPAFLEMTLPGHVHDTPRSASSDVAPRHPEVGEEVPDLDLPQLKAFSLRGMLMHAMLSYRVASEGVGKRGTGLVKELYDELLRLSVNEPELFLPPSGLGKFPHFLKQPRSCPENQVTCVASSSRLISRIFLHRA